MSVIISSTNTRHRITVSNTSASTVSVGNGCTRRVVAPASTIAAVIASARAGDVIGISGVFSERVIVNKAVHLTSVLSDGVIDGENISVRAGTALVVLGADSASISNIEVRKSVSEGLRVSAEATVVNNMVVHSHGGTGIFVSVPNTTVSNCTVYNTAMSRSAEGFWGAGISAGKFNGTGVINYIDNRVFDNGGEGVSCSRLPSASCNYMNNRIYGNYSVDLYVQNIPHGALVEGNIIGPSSLIPRPDLATIQATGSNLGIFISNEITTIPTQNVTVRNNFVSGTKINLYVDAGAALYRTQSNMVYDGNTFVQALETASVRFNFLAMTGSSFTNNTVTQTGGLPAIQNFATGLTISGSGNIVNGVLL